MQHADAVGDALDEIHVVLHDDDGAPWCQQAADEGRGAVGLGVGEPGEGFVQQQHAWLRRQHHAELQPLLLAMRQLAGGTVSDVGQADLPPAA